ncbi:GDSL family lipase [Nonomuraea turkmeniaca]|uniref:GDSL family lipase n=1 Tax=Nonomuraea turkmeniaca TaxID=103838 RepID=A0A5S4FVU3_9ACTN|nr:SGNH/GDSL hydrolase family protein [Nonomuraea turkmeniaca]TMR24917.1 GDSL family lipase [Nonomuraea turkmeniaca]
MNIFPSKALRSIPASDSVLTWAGAIEVEHAAGWSRGWRLPRGRLRLFPGRLRLFPGRRLQGHARAQAGVRITFGTDATVLRGRCLSADGIGPVDLVVHGTVVDAPVASDGSFHFAELPAGEKITEIWLPHGGDFRLVELAVDESARTWVTPATPPPRLITYGSSITQCRAAASPTRTWPALVARNLGLDLTCLGFDGECHLDPMIARLIRDRPAEVIITCLGVNVYGAGTFTKRSFLPAVLGFVSTVRDGHPRVPILVMSPIFSPSREEQTGQTGMSLAEMRADIAEAVRLLREHGDADVHLIDGLDVFGPAQEHLLPDGLHPNAAGYAHMATSITPLVRAHLHPHHQATGRRQ